MARASYIWVVTYASHPEMLAAFTVKHELVTWLRGHTHTEDLWVYRLRDNNAQAGSVRVFTAAEVLEHRSTA